MEPPLAQNNDELVTDEVRDASHQYAMELVVLARAEHQRRLRERPQAPLALRRQPRGLVPQCR